MAHLFSRGYSPNAISGKLGLEDAWCRDVWARHSEAAGIRALGLTLPQIVGRIETRADSMIHEAMEHGAPEKAWRIEKERIGLLQDLGVVDRAVKRHEITVVRTSDSTSDEVRSEVQRLLELEKRKSLSAERVKRIEAKVIDAPPVGGADEEA